MRDVTHGFVAPCLLGSELLLGGVSGFGESAAAM